MIPILVRQYVVEVWSAHASWKRSKWKRYSKLACDHVVCHGNMQRTTRQQVRHPLPTPGQKIVCRRCTMAARRKVVVA